MRAEWSSVCCKVKGHSHELMELSIKVNSTRIASLVKEGTSGPITHGLRAMLWMVCEMDRANTKVQKMVSNIQELGSMVCVRAKGSLSTSQGNTIISCLLLLVFSCLLRSIYEGNFEKGFKEGQGVMTYVSGNRYDGNWKHNKKDGFGTMYWTVNTNEKYYGMWKDNKQNGFGVHIWIEE